MRLASTHAIRMAAQVVDTAYSLCGAGAIFASNPIQRRFQDMHGILSTPKAATPTITLAASSCWAWSRRAASRRLRHRSGSSPKPRRRYPFDLLTGRGRGFEHFYHPGSPRATGDRWLRLPNRWLCGRGGFQDRSDGVAHRPRRDLRYGGRPGQADGLGRAKRCRRRQRAYAGANCRRLNAMPRTRLRPTKS